MQPREQTSVEMTVDYRQDVEKPTLLSGQGSLPKVDLKPALSSTHRFKGPPKTYFLGAHHCPKGCALP